MIAMTQPTRSSGEPSRFDKFFQPRTAECLARFITLEQATARNQSLRLFLAAVRQAAEMGHAKAT